MHIRFHSPVAPIRSAASFSVSTPPVQPNPSVTDRLAQSVCFGANIPKFLVPILFFVMLADYCGLLPSINIPSTIIVESPAKKVTPSPLSVIIQQIQKEGGKPYYIIQPLEHLSEKVMDWTAIENLPYFDPQSTTADSPEYQHMVNKGLFIMPADQYAEESQRYHPPTGDHVIIGQDSEDPTVLYVWTGFNYNPEEKTLVLFQRY